MVHAGKAIRRGNVTPFVYEMIRNAVEVESLSTSQPAI